MTDTQRWQASINYLYPVNDETPMHSGRMEVILYADHVKAVKAAEQRFLDKYAINAESDVRAWANGYDAGLDKARDAVAALPANPAGYSYGIPRLDKDAALAAIDALRGGS